MIKEHRDQAQGLPDLLNYCLLAKEGIMLMKDGAFSSGWSYYGPDLNSAGSEEMESLSSQINNTLCQLGDGWMLHSDLIRKPSSSYPPADQSAFPDPTSHLIDEERRQQYLAEETHFESCYTLIITYKPPMDVESRFKKLFVQGENKNEAGWERVLHFFETKIDQIENSLSKMLVLKRLTSETLLTHLHSCLTGLQHTIRLPKIPVYLDILLGSQNLVGGIYPQIGNHFVRIIGITGLPLETEPGILSLLEQLPVAFRWSNRFILLDPTTATMALKIYRRNWFQKRHGLIGMVKEVFNAQDGGGFQNRDALEMTNDADEAIAEAESGLVRYGYYTSVFVLMGEEGKIVDESAKHLIKQIEMRGFQARIETVNAMEAFLGSLPGHGYQNIRRPLIHSLNLADLLPLTSVWPGLEKNPCSYYPSNSPPLLYAATAGSTPFRLNLHVDDVGHTLIIGPTGSGKSVLIGILAAQHFRYPHAQVFLFDKGYSAYALCKAMGGSHYSIGGENNAIAFYPLAEIDTPQGLNFAGDWIESLLESQGIAVTHVHRKEIRASLVRLSAQKSRTLTDYQGTVQNEDIKNALEFYTLSGAMGNILDADEDSLSNKRFHVFEMGHLMDKGEVCTRPTMLYLFHQIEKRLTGCPTLLLIEEGHTFLKGQFGDRLENWLRELRKKNTAVVFLTQSLAEIALSERKHILLNSCQTKIFLADQTASNDINAELYRAIGLTDRQIEIIKNAVRKRDYYYTSNLGKRLIDFGFGKISLSFLGIGSESDRRTIDLLIKDHGNQWVYHWLKNRGFSDWADYWLRLDLHRKSIINTQEESYACA